MMEEERMLCERRPLGGRRRGGKLKKTRG